MDKPKISIIIPVYNVEDYIAYTIDSLLNQTLKDIEIILIDDGSSDNSKQIIERYSEKYFNIKALYQENSGPSKARNRGIEESKGEYIVFVDSDDLLPEDSLEVRYNTAINENADLVIGGTHKFNSDREWPLERHFLGDGEKIICDEAILWTVGPCNKLFKRDLIEEIRFPETLKYAEDQVFVLESYLNANKIYTINHPIYLYRMRENEANESLSQQIYSDSSNVLRQVLDTWNISCTNIDKYISNESIRCKIKSNYMERLMTADIWPALRTAIMTSDSELQKSSLNYFINIIENIDTEVLNNQNQLKWIIHRLITYYYLFIENDNYILLETLLDLVCKYFNIDSIYHMYMLKNCKSNKLYFEKYPENKEKVLSLTIKMSSIVFKSINKHISNKLMQDTIKLKYIEGLVVDYISLAVKLGITSKDIQWQKHTLEMCINIIEDIDESILNQQYKLVLTMSKGIIDKYLFIHKSNKKRVLNIMTTLLEKLDISTMYKIKKEQGYFASCIYRMKNTNSDIFIYEFLIRRRISKIKDNFISGIDKKIVTLCTKYVFEISKLLPIKKNTIILATNRNKELEGNLKFIYNELKQYDYLDINLYLNNNSMRKRDLVRMYHNFARAKTIVLDDYYRQMYGYKFKKDTEIIQVWHACGAFKKFGMSSIGKKDCNSKDFEKRAHGHYTKVITSSSSINEHYAEAFDIKIDNVISLGAPRADIILDKEYNEFIRTKLYNMYPKLKGKKIITYAPTFRGNPKQRKNFKSMLDYKEILDRLGEEYVIILKLHPVVNEKSVKILDGYKDRVLNLTSYKEINDILMITDYLISDYSSVVFEYSLLEKPMIFFAYDLEDYIDERSFYYKYEDLVPGPIVRTNEEIIDLIIKDSFDKEKIKKFRDKFFEHVDTNSTKRFVDFIINEIVR